MRQKGRRVCWLAKPAHVAGRHGSIGPAIRDDVDAHRWLSGFVKPPGDQDR